MEYRIVNIEVKGVTSTVQVPKRNNEPMYALFNRAIVKLKNTRYSFMAFHCDVFNLKPECGKPVVGNVYMDELRIPNASTIAKFQNVVFTVVE